MIVPKWIQFGLKLESAARSAVAHVNGGKDTNTREKSREDTYIVVRDRKLM
ncbi:hypothetical protein glysoja_008511 [Glycine soja]|nr:hypothetical protein glysoja_008511 [Glycine soja]